MNNQDPQRVVTGRVRLSFVHLFTPIAKKQGDEPKYSTTVLLPKSDVATMQRINAAIQVAITDGVSSRWNGVRPPQVHLPIHDGDGAKPSDGMPYGDECKGHWVFTASSKADRKPDIVDINLNPVMNQSEIYSGVYARISIRFFAYNANGKKGIGCGLGNVQKLEDGEPLAGGRSASSDFGGDLGNGYNQPAYMPPVQQPSYAQPAAPAGQPAYYQPQQPYQQPGQMPYPPAQPTQPGYAQPAQIDPITGKPLTGGIMGLGGQ